jgi:isoleucyl-tRNA synthetase
VRELVSKIQTMRKEAGFEVQDHMDVYESGNDRIRGILEKFENQLKKEVLAETLRYGMPDADAFSKEWTVNGERVMLAVRKRG